MTIPFSHKIVVIDDDQEELVSLLNSLNKNGISFLYYTGQLDQLPPQPLSGIRIVFSDIDLVGGKDEKTKISKLLAVLQKVIAPTNGPYIIVFWTKHYGLIDLVEEQWNKMGCPPLDYLCIEKSDCKDEEGKFSISKIDQLIQDRIQSFGAFHFYLEWENVLSKTGEKVINNFHQLVPKDKNWSHNIYHLLYRMFLAESSEEDANSYTPAEQFAIACRMFNKSFVNELDYHTTQIPFTEQELPATMKGCTPIKQIIPSINQWLWVHNIKFSSIVSGEVLVANNEMLKQCLLNKMFRGSNIKHEDVSLVKVIVTPACDIAQRKLLSDDSGNNLHRIVYAIICDSSFVFSGQDAFWYYQFGPFKWEGKHVRMHFHFGTVGSEYISDSREMLFAIKQEIVFDIQSKIANHMNRLGVSQL